MRQRSQARPPLGPTIVEIGLRRCAGQAHSFRASLAAPSGLRRRARQAGFTLVELLVALAILALMALMSWQGLQALLRSQAQLGARSENLARLQVAMAQWTLDLQQALATPYLNAIAWDGQQLRIVRRSTTEEALVVVAWGTGRKDGVLHWWRWQSPPVREHAALLQAWRDAPSRLGEDAPTGGSGAGGVALVPIEAWQLQFHLGAGWGPPPALAPNAAELQRFDPPEGVRLQLQLPATGGLGGRLQLDWANPGENRGRS